MKLFLRKLFPAAGVLAGLGLLVLASCSTAEQSTVAQEQVVPPPVVVAPPPPPVEEPTPAPAAVEETRVVEAPVAPPPVVPVEPPPPPAPAPPAPTAHEPVDVYFAYNQAVLHDKEKAALDTLVELIKKENGKSLSVEGHCDERGTVAYNLTLGEKRAKAVKEYLQSKGVPAAQILTTSFGKERPVCTEHSTACWKKNRRAHVAVQ